MPIQKETYLPSGIFPTGNDAEWKEAILKELKALPYTSVLSQSSEGIPFEPFYTQSAEADIPYLKNERQYAYLRHLNPPETLYRQTIIPEDIKDLPDELLDSETIQWGLLNFSPEEAETFWSETKGQEVDIQSLYSEDWRTFVIQNNVKGTAAWEWNTVPVRADWPEGFRPYAFRADLYHNAGAESVQEIAFVLHDLISWLEIWTKQGHTVEQGLEKIQIRFALETDLMAGIAKIRAFRGLLFSLLELYGLSEPTAVCILAENALKYHSELDAHNNILRSGTAALSAWACGVYSFEAWPFSSAEPRSFTLRLSRNIYHVLRYEAYLDKVADPLGGSWWLEYYTWQLMQKSAVLLKEIENTGDAGSPEAHAFRVRHIDIAWKTCLEDFSQGKRNLIGVNRFPAELKSQTPLKFSIPGAPSVLRRVAEPFETIRLNRSPEHTYSLHFVSPELQCQARADFIRQFMKVCGWQESKTPETSLIVLCGKDIDYTLPENLDLVNMNKDKQTYVIAGKPEGAEEELRKAGVKYFITQSSDRLALATEFQKYLKK